jgi:phytoene dehydrogenase-like protein
MAILAYYASIGTFAGPKSPGSAYVIMHHIMGEHQGAGGWGFIKGGMGSITQAIAASGRRFGLEVLTDAAIAEVVVANGRATGVVTSDGRAFAAYLERAYDDAKYGWYSARPFVTPVVPTIVDDTLAPPGKHVVNLFGGHAPYTLRNGDWAQERDNFVRNVMAVMDEFAPGFSSQIIDMQVLLAPDIERIVGLPQGHIFQGELSPDQLFFQRPAPHYADYRTPIAGLYQCGSSCHPGGGVSGIPGYNAAREILKDWKRLSRRAA